MLCSHSRPGMLRGTGFKISVLFCFFLLLIKVKTCKPALGYSFAAGTIDGVGAFNFTQGNLGNGCQYSFVQMVMTWSIPQTDPNPQNHLRT